MTFSEKGTKINPQKRIPKFEILEISLWNQLWNCAIFPSDDLIMLRVVEKYRVHISMFLLFSRKINNIPSHLIMKFAANTSR